MNLYLQVTQDDLQLPVAIADTVVELARITGTTVNNISSTISKARRGLIPRPRFVKVTIEEGEDE